MTHIPFQDTLLTSLSVTRPTSIMLKLSLLILAFLIQGCAQTQLVNRRNPGANYEADKLLCERVAYKKYPDIVVPVTPSPAQFQTNCHSTGTFVNCTTTQVDTRLNDKARAEREQALTNSTRGISRAFEVGFCLKEKGWVRENIK